LPYFVFRFPEELPEEKALNSLEFRLEQSHTVTAVPILTHTNGGKLAIEQAGLFSKLGVDLSHVVISHADKTDDIGYHRELLQTGGRLATMLLSDGKRRKKTLPINCWKTFYLIFRIKL
jgi:predicted metal-dependent phosphotriesterase family hydrolase